MVSILSFLLLALAVSIGIPVAVLLLEVVAALALARPRQASRRVDAGGLRVAVLVPAHNESSGLRPTIADIQTQLRPGDRLLVVADNCSDDTAAIATAAGAKVIERRDPHRIGKGYALDWGLRHLAADPPEIVIIIDADCRLAVGTIAQLAAVCAISRRPVQALDLMVAPDESPIDYRFAEFAWRVRNWVRPLGLSALNLPCKLMGTGMAFPWDVIRSADLASGRIVEDLRLSLDLALAGTPAIFCPSAVVTSRFPLSVEGAESQRQRWEHGHIDTILRDVPRFTYLALARRNWDLLALTLELAVPPVAFLGLLVIGTSALAGLAVFFGASSAALIVSAASLAAFIVAVFLSWLTYGRDVLPPSAMLSIGPYVVGKLYLYLRLMARGVVKQWVRTDRNDSKKTLPKDFREG